MLLVDRFEDNFDVYKLVYFREAELYQPIVTQTKIKARDLLSRKDLFDCLIPRLSLLLEQPERDQIILELPLRCESRLCLEQEIFLPSIEEQYDFKLNFWIARSFATFQPIGGHPGYIRAF